SPPCTSANSPTASAASAPSSSAISSSPSGPCPCGCSLTPAMLRCSTSPLSSSASYSALPTARCAHFLLRCFPLRCAVRSIHRLRHRLDYRRRFRSDARRNSLHHLQHLDGHCRLLRGHHYYLADRRTPCAQGHP